MIERNTDFYFDTFFPQTLRGKDALCCSTPCGIEMKHCQGKYEMASFGEVLARLNSQTPVLCAYLSLSQCWSGQVIALLLLDLNCDSCLCQVSL